MTTYGADYLRRLDAAVDEFRTVFEAWMETQNEIPHTQARGLFPTVSTKEGRNRAEARRLELDVAEAAGAAARAVKVTGAYIRVQGAGVLDPIANWASLTKPMALFEPDEVRQTAANVQGRLRTMIAETEAAAESAVPTFAPSDFHPVVWEAAARSWTSHGYRIAVREAAEALTLLWRERLGRKDIDGTEFWQQTLTTNKPGPKWKKEWRRLHWPGDAEDRTVASRRNGLEPLAVGLMKLAQGLHQTVRNPSTHSRKELTEHEAMEQLAAYSFLARLLDQCKLYDPTDSESDGDAEPCP